MYGVKCEIYLTLLQRQSYTIRLRLASIYERLKNKTENIHTHTTLDGTSNSWKEHSDYCELPIIFLIWLSNNIILAIWYSDLNRFSCEDDGHRNGQTNQLNYGNLNDGIKFCRHLKFFLANFQNIDQCSNFQFTYQFLRHLPSSDFNISKFICVCVRVSFYLVIVFGNCELELTWNFIQFFFFRSLFLVLLERYRIINCIHDGMTNKNEDELKNRRKKVAKHKMKKVKSETKRKETDSIDVSLIAHNYHYHYHWQYHLI